MGGLGGFGWSKPLQLPTEGVVLTVQEYLSLKYRTDCPTTMTSSEAEIFEIPYPLQSGWLEAYGSRVLSVGMLDRLKRCLILQANKDGLKARWAKSGLSALGCSVPDLFGA